MIGKNNKLLRPAFSPVLPAIPSAMAIDTSIAYGPPSAVVLLSFS